MTTEEFHEEWRRRAQKMADDAYERRGYHSSPLICALLSMAEEGLLDHPQELQDEERPSA
jgi:hypothetical protein